MPRTWKARAAALAGIGMLVLTGCAWEYDHGDDYDQTHGFFESNGGTSREGGFASGPLAELLSDADDDDDRDRGRRRR